MSDDWAAGDLALCINDAACPYYGSHPAKRRGRIYLVVEALPRDGLRFDGIDSGSPSGGFWAGDFRKIEPLTDEEREQFAADLNVREPANASA